MTTQPPNEILPCPHCGRRAAVHRQEHEGQFQTFVRYVVLCENTACVRYHIEPNNAVRAWNTRVHPTPDLLLDPDMPAQKLRLHMGEMTAQEMRSVRAAIKWANSVMEGVYGVRQSLGVKQETMGSSVTDKDCNLASSATSSEISETSLFNTLGVGLMAAIDDNAPALEIAGWVMKVVLPYLRTTEPDVADRMEVLQSATMNEIEAIRWDDKSKDKPAIMQLRDNLHEWSDIARDRLKSIERFQSEREPVSVSLEKCAEVAYDMLISDGEPISQATPYRQNQCRQLAKAVLDAAGVKYE